MNNSVQITINIPSGEIRDKLIACLSLLDFDGFEENDEHLISYSSEEKVNEEELNDLFKQFNCRYSKSILPAKNWNTEWESSFSPVLINSFCVIRAHFHLPVPGVEHDIIITPKMSFGTGHHATTYLMLQEMSKLDFKKKLVADFGTGTGVLSILAEKLGSKHIWAIDNDSWSIENARENFERNSCKSITLIESSSFKISKEFDIILANINKNVILQNLESLITSLNNKGKILLSGLLKEDEEEILTACLTHNLLPIKTVERDKWISMLFTH